MARIHDSLAAVIVAETVSKETGSDLRRLYPDLAERAEAEDMAYRDFLGVLMAEEVAYRRQTRIQRCVDRAHFPFLKTIDEYDFTFQSAVRLSLLGSALGPEFITQGHSLAFSGPSGTGKTHRDRVPRDLERLRCALHDRDGADRGPFDGNARWQAPASNAAVTSNCAGAPIGHATRRLTSHPARNHHHRHRPELPEITRHSFRNPQRL